jgi:hypothetical protein
MRVEGGVEGSLAGDCSRAGGDGEREVASISRIGLRPHAMEQRIAVF